MRHTVLSTVHGSHLYGLAHPGSDLDTYEVVVGGDKNFARQCNRETDALRLHLSRFQRSVTSGVPQALEALFSPAAEYDAHYEAFLRGLRPGLTAARMTYRRTIVNFGLHFGGRRGSAVDRISPYKVRRHALRLCLNLDELVQRGSFNPRLSPEHQKLITHDAGLDPERYEAALQHYLESAMRGRLTDY